jgi:hypothetical protein
MIRRVNRQPIIILHGTVDKRPEGLCTRDVKTRNGCKNPQNKWKVTGMNLDKEENNNYL